MSAVRAVLALSLALATSCSKGGDDASRAPERSAPPAVGLLPEPPTIVLITIDTLRREHLGCYGYFRPTSPHIDELAAHSLLFERALASMASTLPSHLTMLTGLYPHQHGMKSNLRSASVDFSSELGRLSVAAVLKRCGYRTAAFVSAVPLSPITGIQAGFDTYSCPSTGAKDRRRASETNELLFPWLVEEAAKPGPIFLWVHYFDPHEPSDPLPPNDHLFQTDEHQRAWIRARGIDPERLAARFAHSSRVRRHFIVGEGKGKGKGARAKALSVTLDSVADLMNRYDGEVRSTDDAVGALLDALRACGRYDDALIALAGDHGQSLGENDWFGHGSISNVNTFVPLLLRLPARLGQAPCRLQALVSLADLMPTLLARFELPGSELLTAQFEGEDVLSGEFLRDTALVERTEDELQDGETGRQFALLSDHWKFIHRPAGRDELYDLNGAGEFVDVLAENRSVAERLRAATLDILSRRPALLAAEERAVPDAALLESLRDLGYGGEGSSDDEPEEEGGD